MKKTIVSCVAAVFAVITLSGCIPLVIGTAVGALGGYAVSRDTIQGDTDKPYDDLWYAASDLARVRGIVKKEDPARGYIEVWEDKNRVTVTLSRLTMTATRVRVTCRNKYHLPNLSLAQDYFVRILEESKPVRSSEK